MTVRLTVWNEFRQEKTDDAVRAVYPQGIHAELAEQLAPFGFRVRTATLDEPEHGLSQAALDETDVLIWWGHRFHKDVSDAVADRVKRRVEAGMGLIALHSAHFSKPFIALMGTSCRLGRWKEAGRAERIWCVSSGHPIADGVPQGLEIPQTEMYGEPFEVPPPDELVFVSWHDSGDVFRSGCLWRRGRGRVFYFSPGHETYPIYRNPAVVRVIANAATFLSGA